MGVKKNDAVARAAKRRAQIKGKDVTEVKEPLDISPEPPGRSRYIGPSRARGERPDPMHMMHMAGMEDEGEDEGEGPELTLPMRAGHQVVITTRPVGMGPAAKRRRFNQGA